MPLYALDADTQIIHASRATNGRDYQCRECGAPVRARGGGSRQRHFYHRKGQRKCRSAGKGLVHLAVQQWILNILPATTAEMEVSFPDVSRIADIAWEPQKIVFEVQCAAITPEEVLARNADYGSIGYRVIWILHTDRYGKGMLSPAEQVLRGSTHYYTDIDAKGEGSVFDIVDLVVGRYRKQRLSIGPVQLERPLMDRELEAAPCQWITRRAANGVFFRGDALWSGFVGGDRKVERALYRFWRREQWARWQVLQRCGQLLDTLIFHPYRCLFRLALERASR